MKLSVAFCESSWRRNMSSSEISLSFFIFLRLSLASRITSYNVCYTKLLRAGSGQASSGLVQGSPRRHRDGSSPARWTSFRREALHRSRAANSTWRACRTAGSLPCCEAARTWGALSPGTRRSSVITSYSIHYTKLYERFCVTEPNWRWPPRNA